MTRRSEQTRMPGRGQTSSRPSRLDIRVAGKGCSCIRPSREDGQRPLDADQKGVVTVVSSSDIALSQAIQVTSSGDACNQRLGSPPHLASQCKRMPGPLAVPLSVTSLVSPALMSARSLLRPICNKSLLLGDTPMFVLGSGTLKVTQRSFAPLNVSSCSAAGVTHENASGLCRVLSCTHGALPRVVSPARHAGASGCVWGEISAASINRGLDAVRLQRRPELRCRPRVVLCLGKALTGRVALLQLGAMPARTSRAIERLLSARRHGSGHQTRHPS